MRSRLQLAAILLGTFLLFLPETHYSLVYDDYGLVLNQQLQTWSYVPGYFIAHPSASAPIPAFFYYRPIISVWLRLVYAILGPPSAIWHLSSILAHLLTTACVFLLISCLINNLKAAVLAATLFAIHPIHTEAVAWVSAVSDLLLTTFLTLSVFFYAKRRGVISLPSVLFATLAMFTKETGVVAPALILVYEWTRTGFKPAIVNVLPYLPSALLYFVLRTINLGNSVIGGTPGVSVSAMVLTWPRLLVVYARHLIWPVHLSLSYDVPIETSLWPLLLLVALILGVACIIRNSSANVRFASAWFAITLLPALSIRYLTWDDYTHDRFLYLPSVGLALIVAQCLLRVRFTLPRSVAMCALAVAFCWCTRSNLRIWQDDISLFSRAVETAPRNVMAKYNLAEAYQVANRMQDSYPLLKQLLDQYPDFPLANRDMARYYWHIGNFEEANRYYLNYSNSKRD